MKATPVLFFIFLFNVAFLSAQGVVSHRSIVQKNADSNAETVGNQPSQQPRVGTTVQNLSKVLVLRTGGVIVGQVFQDKIHYRIVGKKQEEIRVRVIDVDFTCNSIEEAYRIKRALLPAADAGKHVELAGWCLQNNLFAKTAKELLDAKRINPSEPRLSLMERRLRVALDLSRQSKMTQAATASKGAAVEGDLHRAEQANSLAEHSSQLSADSQIPVSEKTLQQFTTRIQPILLNSCTTSGCHSGPGPEQMKFDRTAFLRGAQRRVTLNNLHAAMKWVDTADPKGSDLLIKAYSVHGPLKRGVLIGRRVALYRKLEEWVVLAAGKDGLVEDKQIQDPAIVPAAFDTDTGLEIAPYEPKPFQEDGFHKSMIKPLPSSKYSKPNRAGDDTYDELMSDLKFKVPEYTEPENKPIQHGVHLEKWQPKDKFDPEIFNRMNQPKPVDNMQRERVIRAIQKQMKGKPISRNAAKQ